MGTPMNSKEWPRFILPIMRKEWYEKMRAIASPAMQLFGIESSTDSVEYSQGVGAFDLIPEYNSSDAEGNPAAISYDSLSPLHEKTFTHKEYVKGTSIERKLADDNKTGLIKRRAQRLGFSFGTTRATHASSIFVNAFDSGTGGDSEFLCSGSHKLSETNSDTYSNLGATALSYDAMVATLLAGAELNDDRGNPMPSLYNVLYVPSALQAKAYEITKALNKPGGANNDANFLQSQALQVIVDPYLTNAKDWFMVDSVQSKMHLLWFNRALPELALDPSSDYKLRANYRGYMRYSFGWDNARFIYGHNVA